MLLTADRLQFFDDAPADATGVHVVDGRIAGYERGTAPGDGSLLVPGFVEHHSHFRGWASQRSMVDLHDAHTLDDVLARVTAHAAPFVVGFGWPEPVASSPDIVARLDSALGRPVALMSRDGHCAITTPRTLEHLGLTLDDVAVAGGRVERDQTGAWTGVLRETSAWVVRHALPDLLTVDLHRDAVREAAAQGVTTLHDMDGLPALRDWVTLVEADGQLDTNVVVHLQADDLDSFAEAQELAARSPFIRLGGLKLFADGTLGSGTALLHEPELAAPGTAPRAGVAIVERAELEARAVQAAQLGMPLLVHAIGDLAATHVIDALEATQQHWAGLAERPRIEHAQLMLPSDITRCARLGITLSVQPTMLVSDRDTADTHWGHERTPNAFAYRSMLDAGCDIVFGSDAPIEPLNPLAAIHAAVHRDGGAHGLAPARGAWHPEQRITLDDALRASIERPLRTGDRADLVALTGASDTAELTVRT